MSRWPSCAERQLRQRTNPPPKYEGGQPGFWWARQTRRTYRDDSFNMVQDGWVRDGTWEPDTDRRDTYIELMVYLGDNAAITWTEPEFEQER